MIDLKSVFIFLVFCGCSNLGSGQLQGEEWYVRYCLSTFDKYSNRLGLSFTGNCEQAEVYYRFDDRAQKVVSNFYEHVAPWYGFLSEDLTPKEPPWLTVDFNDSIEYIVPFGFIEMVGSVSVPKQGDLFISFTGIVKERSFYYVPVKLRYVGSNYSTEFYFIIRKESGICDIYGQTGVE